MRQIYVHIIKWGGHTDQIIFGKLSRLCHNYGTNDGPTTMQMGENRERARKKGTKRKRKKGKTGQLPNVVWHVSHDVKWLLGLGTLLVFRDISSVKNKEYPARMGAKERRFWKLASSTHPLKRGILQKKNAFLQKSPKERTNATLVPNPEWAGPKWKVGWKNHEYDPYDGTRHLDVMFNGFCTGQTLIDFRRGWRCMLEMR